MSDSRASRTRGIPYGFAARSGGRFQASAEDQRRLRSALDRYFNLIWRSLRRLGVPAADVDDAAQQVFLTFAERLPEVPENRECSFLLGTCLGVASNTRRHRAYALEVPTAAPEASGEAVETPEAALEAKQRRRALDQALNTLSLEQRTVFVLFELEGFSLPEIAQALGIPLGTATSRLRRARLAFEAFVNGCDSSGGAT
jgi:RNA polymerase sigma-70 factor (ECF subfamily)